MPAPPWQHPTGIAAAVARWQSTPSVAASFVADRTLPSEPGTTGPIPKDLDGRLVRGLEERGITSLYLHQLEALASARAGRHTVIATPTASGKSLCFHLPVLDALARDPGATALYLYPTKALSRDQEASVRSLAEDAGLSVGAIVFDGDTPGDARRAARQSARLVMTNPDMLHAGILPQHASWARLFQNLRYVVVDELHTYRGVFGSNVALVLARLMRVARFHGASPTVIAATATIGNPAEHAARLLGVVPSDVTAVVHTTAKRAARRVLVFNPPVVNRELGVRQSYLKCAVRLAGDLLEANVRTLVFGPSRNSVEILVKYLRDRFCDAPSIRDGIVSYRGGYLPDTRRRVEAGLRKGEVLGVVATNALELGIDIGELDAVVCAGYPGSVAELWQRFGRAGRRGETSLAVLVACSQPLDQYLAAHTEHLLDSKAEEARIDPENSELVVQHLKCAAFELPFRFHERFATLGDGDTGDALGYLAEHGVLHKGRERFHWASADSFPANHVSLRRVGWDNTVIIDVEHDRTLAELDWHSTPSMLHEQAIYQHEGEQYQVERLDYPNHKAFVRKVKPDYFTTAERHHKVSVLESSASRAFGRAQIGFGEVSRVEKIVGYKKVKYHTHENAGYGDVRLPEIEMHTTSFWLTLPEAVMAELGRATAVEGLVGVAHALELVSTLALMVDPRDLGRTLEDAADGRSSGAPAHANEHEHEHEQANEHEREHAPPAAAPFSATAYLFDNVPCGVGLAERIYERASELVRDSVAMIARCGCPLGCPSCVGATAMASASLGFAAGQTTAGALPAGTIDRKSAALRLSLALGLSSTAANDGAGTSPRDDRGPWSHDDA